MYMSGPRPWHKVGLANVIRDCHRRQSYVLVMHTNVVQSFGQVQVVFGTRFCVLEWHTCISGLVVEYIVAIDVTRVRFPADAFSSTRALCDKKM